MRVGPVPSVHHALVGIQGEDPAVELSVATNSGLYVSACRVRRLDSLYTWKPSDAGLDGWTGPADAIGRRNEAEVLQQEKLYDHRGVRGADFVLSGRKQRLTCIAPGFRGQAVEEWGRDCP